MEVPILNEQMSGQNNGTYRDAFRPFSEVEYDLAQARIRKRVDFAHELARLAELTADSALTRDNVDRSSRLDEVPATQPRKKRWSITRILLAVCPEFGESAVQFA